MLAHKCNLPSNHCVRPNRAFLLATHPSHQRTILAAVRASAADGSSDSIFDEPGVDKRSVGIIYSQPNCDTSEPVQFPVTVPLLPFEVENVFLPGSVKTLHLYEGRYLALVEDLLSSPKHNKLLGHVVVEQLEDPVGSRASAFPYAFVGDNFVMLMGTLCRVLEVKRSRVGALVRIQAECRMAVKQVTQVQPYIKGTVVSIAEEPLHDKQLVEQQMQQLKSTMQDLQNLTMKFKSKHTQALQHSMLWWEKDVLIPIAAANSSSSSASSIEQQQQQSQASSSSSSSSETLDSDLAERAARLSFAALQQVPEASAMEQLKLLRCCVNALETSDTSKRLKMVHDHMQETSKLLAAKCALKSLNLSSG